MKNSYKYFKNTECQYYPCHKGVNSDAFNCLFCYCPLNPYENCPGTPQYITSKKGRKIKDCSQCTFPHNPENYELIMAFLKQE